MAITEVDKIKDDKKRLIARPNLHKQSTLSSNQQENFEIYNDYLESLIPKDENRNQKYVALVAIKVNVASVRRIQKYDSYYVIDTMAPIPLRFLRKGDYFITLPLLSDNPPIYLCKMDPRSPQVILKENSSDSDTIKFTVTSRALQNTNFVIPPAFKKSDFNEQIISE